MARPSVAAPTRRSPLAVGRTVIDAAQSALHPASVEAAHVARLFWTMTIAAAVIWVAVLALAWHALRHEPQPRSQRLSRWVILGGGVIFPLLVLTSLIAWSMPLLPALRAPVAPDALRIHVSGEQWWWRVRYESGRALAGRGGVELANEIRLPRGERVELRLTSPDVIHSFWVPNLGGKMDMIPGRENRLVVQPTRTGTFRGACAEFCGTAHALMKLHVVVVEPHEFETWLAAQARDASPPAQSGSPTTRASTEGGARAFLANGCGACHAIRGTQARGTLGPDLTHVGSRVALAAGTLPNDAPAFARWIAHARRVKPEAAMPSFDMLPPDELEAIAAYLEALQ